MARNARTALREPATDVVPEGIGEAGAIDFGPMRDLVGFMVRLAQLQLFDAFFRDLGAYGTRPGQISILTVIGRNPGIRQGALADALRIKWSNMAKTVRLMEADGLIHRRVPPSDRRTVELHLTARGKAAVRFLIPVVADSDRAGTAALTARERATLLRLLAKLSGPARQA